MSFTCTVQIISTQPSIIFIDLMRALSLFLSNLIITIRQYSPISSIHICDINYYLMTIAELLTR